MVSNFLLEIESKIHCHSVFFKAFIYLFLFLLVLGFEPKALYLLSKWSDLSYASSLSFYLFIIFMKKMQLAHSFLF
jgi:hypothetical protein